MYYTLIALSLLALGAGEPQPPAPKTGDDVVIPLIRADGSPLSPLGLAGRDVFLQEGCHVCHSVARSADRALVRLPKEELVPMPRPPAGPDLAGVGGKYPHLWHAIHLRDPAAVTPGSVMPQFATPLAKPVPDSAAARVVRLLGLLDGEGAPGEAQVRESMGREADKIVAELGPEAGAPVESTSTLVAVVAYLQQLDRRAPVPSQPAPGWKNASDAELRSLPRERVAAGAEVFALNCVACHGDRGEGAIGPSLADGEWSHGSRPVEILQATADGFPERGMPAWSPVLRDEQLHAVTAYVLQLGAPAAASAPSR